MNSHQDSEEDIARRREFFAKFAKRSAARKEKERLERVLEEPQFVKEGTSKIGTPWLTGIRKEAWEIDQLAYVKQYSAEYQLGYRKPQVIENQDDSNCAASTMSDQETIISMRNAQNRFLMRRGGRSIKSSIMDFERTSTVKPPSILTEDADFTSNVNVDDLRRTYFSRFKINTELPIYSQRKYLINSINSYSVVMVSGATGCGKTTQVPAYILEDAILEHQYPKAPIIYVSQPRRIAARSIAERVCQEHNWTLGSVVGYHVGLDKRIGPDTVLVFCTAGVLLQKLIADKSLKNYTHIIVDEAHERDAETDLLLMFIRFLMRKEMSCFRLIVMSATMEMTKLKTYFTFKTNYGHKALTTPSIVKVAGNEPNDIQIVYLDQLQIFGIYVDPPEFDLESPDLHEPCLRAAESIIVDIIPRMDTYGRASSSTLVFLPGMAEIQKLHDMLRRHPKSINLDIIPLHSCLSHDSQLRVFRESEPGQRKVILATNIAESSITVRDAGFVIDFCLTKVNMKDPITNFPSLTLQWTTSDKSIQRAGRTGRCCPGKVFRMVTTQFYRILPAYAKPELLVAPLEQSVLRVKSFQMGEVKALLAVVLDPPPINDIRTAVLELKQIGALSSTYEGKVSDIDGDMTELGRVIASLPIDVHLSKLIVMASVLDVLEDAIIVASCLATNRTVVKHLFNNKLETYRMKLDWAKGSYSDLFVNLDVYRDYMDLKERGKDMNQLITYCQNNHLDERKLHEVDCLAREIKARLENVNITVLDQPNRVRNQYEDELMLKIAFCAAFYPNYFLSKEVKVDEVHRELCGLDPVRTLVMHNMPVNHVPLYRSQVLQQVRGEKNSAYNITIDNEIDYIADCSRALLVFGDKNQMLSDVSTDKALGDSGVIQPTRTMDKSIYMAIKLGEYSNYYVREYSVEKASKRIQFYRDQVEDIKARSGNRLIPSLMKVVVGREPDNRRFTHTSDEDFFRLTQENYYVEVSCNEAKEAKDIPDLDTLEKIEARLCRVIEHPKFRNGKKNIRGPASPVHMQFQPVLDKSRGYSVEIDSLSVNSILLNPDYTQPRRQMLVAAGVRHSKKSKVLVCDTTLMPNIRGFPTLMALLFAQYYRVVYDEAMKCINGAIFGIGWDEGDIPIDKSYEVELGFDIQITKDDIELINRARRNISELIKFIDIQNPGAPRAQLQQQLRQIVLSLIKKRRYPLEETNLSSINYTSGRYFKDKHNVPQDQLTELEEGKTRVFLPIMQATKEYTEFDMYEAIRTNLGHLNAVERREVMLSRKECVNCLLCGRDNVFFMQQQVVGHLYSDSHVNNLRDFEVQEERAKARMEREQAAI